MEPVDVALPPSRASSPSLSRSLSPSPSPSQSDSEWPFPALPPSCPSSQSSSRWPFRAEGSPSSSSSSSSNSSWRFYRPVPASNRKGIYPPVLPPPDFFDLEEEEKRIKEKMFKKDNMVENHLYDETGKVNLPVDEKGILILDPESRTRMIDALVESNILGYYRDWVYSAIEEAEELGAKQTVDWLQGLMEAVLEDYQIVDADADIVVDEERKTRGLTDWETHYHWWTTTGFDLWRNRDNDERQGGMEDRASSDDQGATLPEEEDLSAVPPLASPPAQSTTSEDYPATPPLDLFALWS